MNISVLEQEMSTDGGVYHLKHALSGCRFPCCTSSDLFSRHVSITRAELKKRWNSNNVLNHFSRFMTTVSDKTQVPFFLLLVLLGSEAGSGRGWGSRVVVPRGWPCRCCSPCLWHGCCSLSPQGADAPVGDVRAVPGHAPDQPAVRPPAAQLRGVHHHEGAAALEHRWVGPAVM